MAIAASFAVVWTAVIRRDKGSRSSEGGGFSDDPSGFPPGEPPLAQLQKRQLDRGERQEGHCDRRDQSDDSTDTATHQSVPEDSCRDTANMVQYPKMIEIYSVRQAGPSPFSSPVAERGGLQIPFTTSIP